MSLVVLSTHPIQYQAPIYRILHNDFNIPVTVVYASDFSLVGYRDEEFDTQFAWDVDLISGYEAIFLSRSQQNNKANPNSVSVSQIRQALHHLNPSMILLLGYRPGFDLKAFYSAYRAGVPLLFRAETTDHALKRSPIKKILRDIFLRWFYSRCTKLLYIGQKSLKHYQRLQIAADKLVFSPYGVSTAPFELNRSALQTEINILKSRYKIRLSDQVLLYSGKLVSRKGCNLFLQAVKCLPGTVQKNLVVLFLGDGKQRTELQYHAETALPDVRVKFAGFKNQSELSPFYHLADLLIVPSRISETWGLVVNEALHHGTPCVVSNQVGCAPDLILNGQTGYVFETGNKNDLAAKIQTGLALAEQSTTAANCRNRAQKYNLQAASQGIATAYQTVMNQMVQSS